MGQKTTTPPLLTCGNVHSSGFRDALVTLSERVKPVTGRESILQVRRGGSQVAGWAAVHVAPTRFSRPRATPVGGRLRRVRMNRASRAYYISGQAVPMLPLCGDLYTHPRNGRVALHPGQFRE